MPLEAITGLRRRAKLYRNGAELVRTNQQSLFGKLRTEKFSRHPADQRTDAAPSGPRRSSFDLDRAEPLFSSSLESFQVRALGNELRVVSQGDSNFARSSRPSEGHRGSSIKGETILCSWRDFVSFLWFLDSFLLFSVAALVEPTSVAWLYMLRQAKRVWEQKVTAQLNEEQKCMSFKLPAAASRFVSSKTNLSGPIRQQLSGSGV